MSQKGSRSPAAVDLDGSPSADAAHRPAPPSRAGGYDESICSVMATLTTNFAFDTDLERTLASVTAAAVQLVPGVDYADVMLLDEGGIRSLTPTAPLLAGIDEIQRHLQQGPCLEAAVSGAVIRCPDLDEDARWPGFAAAAVAAGVHSMLSFQLCTGATTAGSLNLFGRSAHTFDAEAETIGAMLATIAALALVAADKRQQFASALASRDLIGQAKGILMNQFRIGAVRAFDMLRDLSQSSNAPVRTIAQQVVDSM